MICPLLLRILQISRRNGLICSENSAPWTIKTLSVDRSLKGSSNSFTKVVKLGFYQSKISDQDLNLQSHQLLKRFDIEHLESRRFSEISMGQKQRAWLAFALAQDKKVILMDEPLAAVDLQSRKNFYSILNTVSKENRTLVLVTHDLEIAMEFCEHMVHLHQGAISFEGPPKNF